MLLLKAESQIPEFVEESHIYANPCKYFFSSPVCLVRKLTFIIFISVNELPVLKADAIKYVMTFRSQLGHGELLASIPCLINLLTASSQVIHSYAAIALDKILSMETADTKKPVIQKEELSPFAESLLSKKDISLTFFKIFSFSGSNLEKVEQTFLTNFLTEGGGRHLD